MQSGTHAWPALSFPSMCAPPGTFRLEHRSRSNSVAAQFASIHPKNARNVATMLSMDIPMTRIHFLQLLARTTWRVSHQDIFIPSVSYHVDR